jgi:hypothetical protein
VVLFLLLDVGDHPVNMRTAEGEGSVAFLLSEEREGELVGGKLR